MQVLGLPQQPTASPETPCADEDMHQLASRQQAAKAESLQQKQLHAMSPAVTIAVPRSLPVDLVADNDGLVMRNSASSCSKTKQLQRDAEDAAQLQHNYTSAAHRIAELQVSLQPNNKRSTLLLMLLTLTVYNCTTISVMILAASPWQRHVTMLK